MRIVVCIKQVPDTTDVKLDKDTNTLIREGVPSIINPFDTYALEEGIRLTGRLGGTVTVLSMGPPQVESALREALAMGCNEAVLLSDRAFAGADTLATSYALAAAVRKLGGADLIICGKQAIDGDTAQVGPGIAELLDIPHATYVKRVAEVGKGSIQVHRMTEYGYDVLELPLPALITVVKEINEPRLPTLRGLMRSRTAPVTVWGATELGVDPERVGLKGSATEVVRVFTPELRGDCELLAGSALEQAEGLLERLRRAGAV